jgi:hypothetical protein
MHIDILDTTRLVANSLHNGFPSICQWRGNWYLAYRQAATHDIVPKGHVTVMMGDVASSKGTLNWDCGMSVIEHDVGDVRDPRLIPSEDAIYCMCGVYVPQHGQPLSSDSTQNIIQTMMTYTTDGWTWAPLRPLLRPNVWGWSMVEGPRSFITAAYRCGKHSETHSIELYGGSSPLEQVPLGTIYDGSSSETRYYLPCEPVLYQPAPDVLGCLVRTEGQMVIGVASYRNLRDWRWWNVTPLKNNFLHASSLIQTKHGWLMVARCLYEAKTKTRTNIDFSTHLYTLQGQHTRELTYLASEGDCAYGSICAGVNEDEYLVAYYSAHKYFKQGTYGATLPAADIWLVTVKVSA